MRRFQHLALAGLSMAGLVMIAWFLVLDQQGRGYDAYAYWDVDLGDIYGRSLGQLTAFGAFRYSPPIAFAFAPFHLLSWPQFLAVWTVVLIATLAVLLGRRTLAVCAFVGVPMSIYQGNIDILIAAAIVIAGRWPAAWAFPILTKATPALGLLWYAVRREWRPLGIAIGVTTLIALPTLILVPDAWGLYLRSMVDNAAASEAGWLAPRLLASTALVVLAARTDRPWLLAVAIALAQPAFSLRSASVAIAAVAMTGERSPWRSTGE